MDSRVRDSNFADRFIAAISGRRNNLRCTGCNSLDFAIRIDRSNSFIRRLPSDGLNCSILRFHDGFQRFTFANIELQRILTQLNAGDMDSRVCDRDNANAGSTHVAARNPDIICSGILEGIRELAVFITYRQLIPLGNILGEIGICRVIDLCILRNGAIRYRIVHICIGADRMQRHRLAGSCFQSVYRVITAVPEAHEAALILVPEIPVFIHGDLDHVAVIQNDPVGSCAYFFTHKRIFVVHEICEVLIVIPELLHIHMSGRSGDSQQLRMFLQHTFSAFILWQTEIILLQRGNKQVQACRLLKRLFALVTVTSRQLVKIIVEKVEIIHCDWDLRHGASGRL